MSAADWFVYGGAAAGWAALAWRVASQLRERVVRYRLRTAKAIISRLACDFALCFGSSPECVAARYAPVDALTPAELASILRFPWMARDLWISAEARQRADAWRDARSPAAEALEFLKAASRG